MTNSIIEYAQTLVADYEFTSEQISNSAKNDKPELTIERLPGLLISLRKNIAKQMNVPPAQVTNDDLMPLVEFRSAVKASNSPSVINHMPWHRIAAIAEREATRTAVRELTIYCPQFKMVNDLYRKVFQPQADPLGLGFWAQMAFNGLSEDEIEAHMRSSPEAKS